MTTKEKCVLAMMILFMVLFTVADFLMRFVWDLDNPQSVRLAAFRAFCTMIVAFGTGRAYGVATG